MTELIVTICEEVIFGSIFGEYLSFFLILAERKPSLFPLSVVTSQVQKLSLSLTSILPTATASYSGL